MIEACLTFSNSLVKARKRNNHIKRRKSFKYHEQMAQLVGAKMQAANILKVIKGININV